MNESHKDALKGKTVLVVDDETDLRHLIEEEMELMGASVLAAENGAIAFQIAIDRKPDVIISDIRMPGGDGIDLLSRIRNESSYGNTKFIFITGFSDLTPERLALLGTSTVLAKPFGLKQLRQSVLDALTP